MSPKQKKLAAKAPPPNKIDAKDFAVLKAEKAKGRGMGLQDEKIKPGKVMKANKGKMFDGYLSTFDASAEASTPKSQRGVTTIVGVKPGAEIGKGKKRFTSMEAMRTAKGFRTIDGKQETSSQFNKRRMALAAAKKAAKASTFGKIALGIGTAGVAAQQYLKSKMNKKDEPKKKMGGGMMMQKPMGYNIGGYESKEDRKKAEKNIKQARSTEGLRSFLSDAPKINQPMRKERYMEGKKARHSAFKKKLGRTAAGIASSLNPVTSSVRLIGKVMGKESKKRDFQKGDYGDISVKKMGGGMMKKYSKGGGLDMGGPKAKIMAYAKENMDKDRLTERDIDMAKEAISRVKKKRALQGFLRTDPMPKKKMGGGMMQRPMGYKSGTMVKARGCKLGRTRPTKIT